MVNDWRLRDQQDYLQGKTLYFHPHHPYSETWDHEHCEFCSQKISNDIEAYSTMDDYYWVCKECFKDFSKYCNLHIFNPIEHPLRSFNDTLETEIGSLQGNKIYELKRVITLLKNLKSFISISGSVTTKLILVNLSLNPKQKHEIIPTFDTVSFISSADAILSLETLQTQLTETYRAKTNLSFFIAIEN